jgi:hypothetical protein
MVILFSSTPSHLALHNSLLTLTQCSSPSWVSPWLKRSCFSSTTMTPSMSPSGKPSASTLATVRLSNVPTSARARRASYLPEVAFSVSSRSTKTAAVIAVSHYSCPLLHGPEYGNANRHQQSRSLVTLAVPCTNGSTLGPTITARCGTT